MTALIRSLTASQVAEALFVSQATVGRYAVAGRIPFDTTPGGHRRYNLAEVRSALRRESTRPELDPDVLLTDLRALTKAVAHLTARIEMFVQQSRAKEEA
jgi:DNA-binding transcriptional MerR regulator